MQYGHILNASLAEGLKLLSRGEFQDVHTSAIAMIKQDVEDSVPYFLLGHIALEHRNVEKSVSLFKQAAAYDLGNALYHAHWARALTLLNRQTEAHAVAEVAASCEITDAHTADTIGVVFSRTGFHDLAINMFEKAVALNPQPANFHFNLGSSLQFLGDFERARIAYEAAIARDTEHVRAWSSLISLSKQSEHDNHLVELAALFDRHKNDSDARLHIGHAIAKSYEDLGDYPASFAWLGKAKKLKREEIEFDRDTELALFTGARSSMPAIPQRNTSPASPIFILGLPRTGTTLVDRIISSHRSVCSAGELNTFAGLIKKATKTPSNLVLDEETILAASHTDLAAIGREYITATARLARGASHFTDKMPLNFFYAGLIHRALPNARIIALRRGSMDSCLSNYRQLFSTGYSYYNYTFDLEDTAAYFQSFDSLMRHWREILPPSRFMEVSYEDIVYKQEEQTKRLLNFCDLEWDDACMRFHENAAPVSTASSVQVRQPLYSGSIGRWKKYGSALGPLKSALGDLATSN